MFDTLSKTTLLVTLILFLSVNILWRVVRCTRKTNLCRDGFIRILNRIIDKRILLHICQPIQSFSLVKLFLCLSLNILLMRLFLNHFLQKIPLRWVFDSPGPEDFKTIFFLAMNISRYFHFKVWDPLGCNKVL